MASSIIHLAVAKKVAEKYNINNIKDYYLGSIAPDISKQIGQNKEESHLSYNTAHNIPNIRLFIKRYPLFKYNSFDLGYYTHLYTDKKWLEDFLPKTIKDNSIKILNSPNINITKEEITDMIYSDYTNLNTKIIEDYNLDLSIFNEKFTLPKTRIKEVPINNLDILVNKMEILIENTKEEKTYTFDDIQPIKRFINQTANEIIEKLSN